MLTIYGVYRSRASRVYWAAHELGIPFESVPVIQARRVADPLAADAPLNTKSPAFLAVNPMGLIPSIRDGDLVLHESLAITLYLARKHGGPISPASVEEEALMIQWTLWAATEVEPHSVEIVRVYDSVKQETADGKARIEKSVNGLAAPFSVLDAHLAQHAFVVGDRFTVADINLAEVLRYAQTENAMFAAHPNIGRWIAACQSRPAYLAMQETRSREAV